MREVDTELLAQQAEEAKNQKTNLQQGLIRKQFELDDIEGQLDDIASHLIRLASRMKSGFASKHVLKLRKKRSASACVIYKSQLTDQYQISYTGSPRKAHELENLNLAEQEVKDLEKAIRSLGPSQYRSY